MASKKTKKHNINADDGSNLQKSVINDREKEEKEKQLLKDPVSPYMFLSEPKEQGEREMLQKKLEERRRKQAAEKEKAEKVKLKSLDRSMKRKGGESGFRMVSQDISRIFGKKKHPDDGNDSTKKRQEAMRKRTAAKYLKLILTGERNEPELCPRIFAILLVWLIVVITILGIVYFQTTWLDPLKVMMGSAKKEKAAFCFAKMELRLLPLKIGPETTVQTQ